MRVKPMLGDWELPNVESIKTLEHRAFVELPVPGRNGSVFQDMSPDPARIIISGSLYGDEARDVFLQQVRGKFQAGEPVTFVADILTATDVQHVVIETLRFEESGARPDEVGFYIELRESPPPPPSANGAAAQDAGLMAEAGGFPDAASGASAQMESPEG